MQMPNDRPGNPPVAFSHGRDSGEKRQRARVVTEQNDLLAFLQSIKCGRNFPDVFIAKLMPFIRLVRQPFAKINIERAQCGGNTHENIIPHFACPEWLQSKFVRTTMKTFEAQTTMPADQTRLAQFVIPDGFPQTITESLT